MGLLMQGKEVLSLTIQQFQVELGEYKPMNVQFSVFREGDQAVLGFSGDKGVVLVFVSQSEIEDYFDAMAAKDIEGVGAIVKEGRGFIVSSGTKVRIIGAGFIESGIQKGALVNYQVRILNDELYSGRSGWVRKEWVKQY